MTHAEGVLPSCTLSPTLSDHDDTGGSSRHAQHKLTDISLHLVSSNMAFLAATIQDGGSVPAISCSQMATLTKNALGHAGKIDGITAKQLAPGSWLLTGFLYSDCDASRLSAGGSGICDNVQSDTCRPPLNGNTAEAEAVGSEDDEGSSDGGDGSSNCDLGEDDECTSTRKRVPCSELEEQRLLAYKKENKPWDWIFGQFPNRTYGAVRTRGLDGHFWVV